MNGLSEGIEAATRELIDIENDREAAIAYSRRVIRLTKTVIHGIHAGVPYREESEAMDGVMDELRGVCGLPSVETSGPVQDAMGEYAEAKIFTAVMEDRPVPSHSDLGITAGSWILGLADVEGELRRAVMTRLMDGDLDSAKSLFSKMEEIHEQIMLLDVPDAVVPIRRQQDIARGIMDKTRSDITTASVMRMGRN